MKTTDIPGRYKVGITLYRDVEGNAVDRTQRAAMTAEQIAALTQLRVVAVKKASVARQNLADASEGSVGYGETTTVEVLHLAEGGVIL